MTGPDAAIGAEVSGATAGPSDASASESAAWDAFVTAHPLATYLQLSGWARVKAANGWSSRLVEASAPGSDRIGGRLLLRTASPLPWTFAYAPRGPLASAWTEPALAAWTEAVRAALTTPPARRVALLRMDPEIEPGGLLDPQEATVAMLRALGWRPAPDVQPSVTRLIDLAADEASLWSDLRKKWRQYVNRARALGVTVTDEDADRDPTALPSFHRLMRETSRRTGTPIRTEDAYRDIWQAFRAGGGARLLFARDATGTPQAALLLVRAGRRVVEPYGGMTALGAEQRANYVLKWEAIRSSREQGASSYDLWGLVHPGIRQFKEGFGGREVRLIGAWDLALSGPGALAVRVAERLRRTPRPTTATTTVTTLDVRPSRNP